MVGKENFNAFKAYDIRGVVPSEVNEDLFYKIGNIISRFENEILISNDVRKSGNDLKKSFIKGFMKGGGKVIDLGLLPNPTFFFKTFEKKVLGAYITASHNPPEYNGIKLCKNGVGDIELQDKVLNSLKKGFEEHVKEGGVFEKDFNTVSEYFEYLNTKIKNLSNVRIGVDCLNASGGLIIEEFVKYFNLNAEILNKEPLSDFGGKTPEPNPETITSMKNLIKSKGLDAGFIFDGDVDRCLILDSQGREVPSDYLVINFKKLLNYSKIIASIDMSSEINKYEHEFIRVGHVFLEKKISEIKNSVGAEASHHYYFSDCYPFSDGFLVILKVLELMNKTSLELIKSEGIKFNLKKEFKEIEGRDEFFNHLRTSLVKREGVLINTLDGVRLDHKNYWFVCRVSNTQPLIRITGEAKEREIIEDVQRLLD